MIDRIQVTESEAQEAVEIVYDLSHWCIHNKGALDDAMRKRLCDWHFNFIAGKRD